MLVEFSDGVLIVSQGSFSNKSTCISMGAPVQGRGNKRGLNNQRGGIGKGRGQGRAFNGNPASFGNPGMMRPRGLFRGGMCPPMPPMRGGRPPLRGEADPRPPRSDDGFGTQRAAGHAGPAAGHASPAAGYATPAAHDDGQAAVTASDAWPVQGRHPRQRTNRPSMRNIDLSNSWVTDAVKAEFAKKDELLAAAKTSQSKEDWAKYREQREKCNKVYQAAEMEFIGQQESHIQ
ncbi:hypothetical protein NQ318_014211 [Aromia moschata]|uniref:Uncharacterized protein n=1 Tax=Aromia moschata TaxID=1265417 RepID=A0AAV8Z0A2_9CUCU|nr:hypothetical protein NQ318_014211 [Aromia moschata]